MGDDSNLSVNNMMELAMGLSMASLFANAMNSAFQNTARTLNNDQVAEPPRYIHAIIGGMQKGPYSVGEIAGMIRSGDITLDTYIWKPGMPEWKLAKEVGDLNPTFEYTPPAAP